MKKSMRMAMLLPCFSYYKSRDPEWEQVFIECDVNPALINKPNHRIETAKIDKLLGIIKQRLDMPELGLFTGAKFELRNFGLLGFLLSCCCNVKEVFELSLKYYNYLSSPPSPVITRSDSQVIVEHTISAGPESEQRTRAELFVSSIYRCASFMSFDKLQVKEVCFEFAEPEYSELYEQYFPGVAVRFSQPRTRMVFDRKDMSISLDFPNPEIKQKVQRELDAVLGSEADESFSARIESILVSHDQGFAFNLSMKEVASIMHLGSKTLSRRLAEEGTSFSVLHDDIRRRCAMEMLTNTRYKVDHIALELGFTDRSAFDRAFRRWEGLTPSSYRKQLQEPDN